MSDYDSFLREENNENILTLLQRSISRKEIE